MVEAEVLESMHRSLGVLLCSAQEQPSNYYRNLYVKIRNSLHKHWDTVTSNPWYLQPLRQAFEHQFKGQWLAYSNDGLIVASRGTDARALNAARRKGVNEPWLYYVEPQDLLFNGLAASKAV